MISRSSKDPASGNMLSIDLLCSAGSNGWAYNCDVGCYNYWNFSTDGGGEFPVTIEEDKIDNQLTDPCAYQIFTELENGIFQSDGLKPEIQVPNNPENLNFSEAILKLFNDSPNTNLIIQNGNTGISNANTVGATITIEEDKIDNQLTGKADCVYQKMVDNNNNINWILENFKDGDQPSKFGLIFKCPQRLAMKQMLLQQHLYKVVSQILL